MKRNIDITVPGLSAEQRELLARIYEIYHPRMYKLAYGILRNRQDAEDAVQEAFYHVCLNAGGFDLPESESTAAQIYIYTRNVAINCYHRKKRYSARISDGQDNDRPAALDDSDIALMIEREESAAQLRAAVEALDPIYREVIYLKYYEYKTNSEIAQMLGLSRNLVNGRIFRAKKILRKMLE